MNAHLDFSTEARVDQLLDSGLFSDSSRFAVLRLDLLHPEVSGNKWFKLHPYLSLARAEGKKKLVSFGGPWSNHLVALAAAGHTFGFETFGIVRGEKPAVLSSSLLRMQALGMELRFTDRRYYRVLQTTGMMQQMIDDYDGALIIPEGGRGEPGVRGAAAIAAIKGLQQFTHICLAVGTGTTIAGVASASPAYQQLTGIPVLKGTSGHAPIPSEWMSPARGGNRITLMHGFDHGGYARHSQQLLNFMNSFYDTCRIPSDFIYTGKLFFAIARLSMERYFPAGSNVLMIHTGGLQGNQSLPAHSLHF